MFDKLQTLSIDTEVKMDENIISKSVVIVSNQIDNVDSSNCDFDEYLSTQPFTILDVHENHLSS
jgi:hypothetical protein